MQERKKNQVIIYEKKRRKLRIVIINYSWWFLRECASVEQVTFYPCWVSVTVRVFYCFGFIVELWIFVRRKRRKKRKQENRLILHFEKPIIPGSWIPSLLVCRTSWMTTFHISFCLSFPTANLISHTVIGLLFDKFYKAFAMFSRAAVNSKKKKKKSETILIFKML